MREAERLTAYFRPWALDLRLAGAWPVALGAAVMAGGLALSAAGLALWPPARMVEAAVPLALGLSAALLLAPDGEPALEVLCACPRPPGRLLLDRLLLMAVLHGLVAVAGSLVSLALPRAEPLPLLAARWLSPGVALGGTALFVTQLTRQGNFGALLAFLLWGGMLLGGDSLAQRWPALRWLHFFLQPGAAAPLDYVLNRLALLAMGAVLVWRAVRLVSDVERLLAGGR